MDPTKQKTSALGLQSAVQRSMFKYRMLGALSDLPKKEWLVQGRIGIGEVVAMYGEPGVGKSVLATDLAFAVSRGRPWFGRRVVRGAALYLALERSAVTERRFGALRREADDSVSPIAISNSAFSLSTDGSDVEKVIAACAQIRSEQKLPVRLIVVDTLSRSIAGQDENSAAAISTVANNLSRIAGQTGATVVVLHHATKATGALRGSSALLGAVDCAIHVSRSRNGTTAKIDKSNDTAEGAEFSFSLRSVEIGIDPETGEAGTTVVVFPHETSPDDRTNPLLSPRAISVFEIIKQLHGASGAIRREVLAEGRKCGCLSQIKRSSSEQLRQILHELQCMGLTTHDADTIRIASPGKAGVPEPIKPAP